MHPLILLTFSRQLRKLGYGPMDFAAWFEAYLNT
jgi:hypothetical protein